MPRRARGPVPAGIYHVTLRSAGPIVMFCDDDDRTDFCNRLAKTARAKQWVCHGFCLMPTHFHLVLRVGDDLLQPGMHSLMCGYAQRFNARHDRSGHLRGSRYYAGAVATDGHMLALLRYLARNPVEAGLCNRPEDWLWSSYRDCAGIAQQFPFVDSGPFLGYFGPDPKAAAQQVRDFVDGSVTGERPRS